MENPKTFKDIYKFTFNYIKEQPSDKIIPLETVKSYIKLLLPNNPHSSYFCEFLDNQTDYKSFNFDQWSTLLDFFNNVSLEFSNYDMNGSWPVIFDEYVVWKKEKDQ